MKGNITTWKDEIEKIGDCPQRQDGLIEQLKDLIYVANKLGFYDAAEYLEEKIASNN